MTLDQWKQGEDLGGLMEDAVEKEVETLKSERFVLVDISGRRYLLMAVDDR